MQSKRRTNVAAGRMSYLPETPPFPPAPSPIFSVDMKQFISAKVYLFSFLSLFRSPLLHPADSARRGVVSLRLLNQQFHIISYFEQVHPMCVCVPGDVHHLLSQTFKLKFWEGVAWLRLQIYGISLGASILDSQLIYGFPNKDRSCCIFSG